MSADTRWLRRSRCSPTQPPPRKDGWPRCGSAPLSSRRRARKFCFAAFCFAAGRGRCAPCGRRLLLSRCYGRRCTSNTIGPAFCKYSSLDCFSVGYAGAAARRCSRFFSTRCSTSKARWRPSHRCISSDNPALTQGRDMLVRQAAFGQEPLGILPERRRWVSRQGFARTAIGRGDHFEIRAFGMVDVPDAAALAYERIVEGGGDVIDGRGRYAPGKMLEPPGGGTATPRFCEPDRGFLRAGG